MGQIYAYARPVRREKMSHCKYALAGGANHIGRRLARVTLCACALALLSIPIFVQAHAQKLGGQRTLLSPAEPEAYRSVFAADRIDARDDKPPALLATQNEAGMVSSQIPDADLQDAFMKALKSVEELRKKDRSTVLECTYLFAEFHRYQQTEPYVLFFKSIEIPVLLDDRNQRHYVAFSINHQRLWSMGYQNFLRGDRLGIVFTTSSAASTEVTSFRVTLLNSDHL